MGSEVGRRIARPRKDKSRPLKFLLNRNLLLLEKDTLDFGCGRGTDAEYLKCDKYDPIFFNQYPTKLYDQILCFFVLNVILSETDRNKCLLELQYLLKEESSKCFVAVRRDLKKDTNSQRIVHLEGASTIAVNCLYEMYQFSKSDSLSCS